MGNDGCSLCSEKPVVTEADEPRMGARSEGEGKAWPERKSAKKSKGILYAFVYAFT